MSTKPTLPNYPGDSGDEQPDDNLFSPQVRYAGPDVTCGQCSYFDGKSQCNNQAVIADQGGTVDAGGRCEEFEAAGQGEGNGPDALTQALAASKPFGGSPMGGMSNS